jgi:hypothetical protein
MMPLLASDDVLVTSVPGRSAIPSEHGANDVADPQVPMTWWEDCPVAAPSVNVPPEIVHVSQFAPGALQEVAPPEGGGKTLLPCARPSWANQPIRMAHAANQMKRLETCISVFVITAVSFSSAASSLWGRHYAIDQPLVPGPMFWPPWPGNTASTLPL